MNIQLVRTDSKHPEFMCLVQQLDAYLAVKDGDEHSFYNQFNCIEHLNHVVLVINDQTAVACGAFKQYDSQTVEIKRMFTATAARNQGIAGIVLNELENWASDLGFKKVQLETGQRQTEALSFYQKCGYYKIPCYGPYKDMENSVCFGKEFKS